MYNRIGFKRFGRDNKYCATFYQHLGNSWDTTKMFYPLPFIRIKWGYSERELILGFLFWELHIEDESQQNMGCKKS